MKFRYYMRGFGAGLIVAAVVMLVAGMIEKNNNNLTPGNMETQSSGSVIAFTKESTEAAEKETESVSETVSAETTQTYKETTTAPNRENESQRPTASIVIGDGSGEVKIEFKGVGTASEAADILYSAGIIEDKLGFYTYMDISGYAVRIRDGEYSLKPGDSYETIARTITQSN